MIIAAVELSRRIGRERVEAMLKFQVDQAMLDWYRKQFPPIDNDMLLNRHILGPPHGGR